MHPAVSKNMCGYRAGRQPDLDVQLCGPRRLRPGFFSQVLRPQTDRHGSDSLGVVLLSFRLMAGFAESLSGVARVRPEAMSGRLVGDTIFGQLELVVSRLDCHQSKTTLSKVCSPFTKAAGKTELVEKSSVVRHPFEGS